MDERFLKDEGLDVFTGNELVLKGALENEVALITGYPGSPISDIFDAASANAELLKQHGILAEMAHNEALAVARLNGSRMAGVRALAAMKSVGLHVAADGLALGNLSEPENVGGSVVVVGDDPWIESTQINNDSRYLSQHLFMPVLEPATFQEIKDWVGSAFVLSSTANLYITYLLTTPQADGGGTVWVHPNRYPAVNTREPVTLETQRFDLGRTVLLPPRTWTREATLPTRFQQLLAKARELGLNQQIALSPQGARQPLGFVAAGMSYCFLKHALLELGLQDQVPILKLGITYPLDEELLLEFGQHVDALCVIEEKRGFIEGQVIQALHAARQKGRSDLPVIWGKQFPFGLSGIPEERGLNASILKEKLIPLFLHLAQEGFPVDTAKLQAEERLLQETADPFMPLPVRTPTFCPGCPHRDSSSVFLQIKKDFRDLVYMKRQHQRPPVDLVFHGETGCFTMLMFEPNQDLMHNYSGMGLGGGTGAGLDPFITNKQVVFLGDSTFFHSGMLALSDSLKNGQDITYVILDNKTTAMTGHQPTPATDYDLMGEKTFAQDIEKIVRGMMNGKPFPLRRVNPSDREGYRDLLEDIILLDGVKVIIADKECGLTYHRRVQKEKKSLLRRQGFVPRELHVNITPEVCEFCLECTRITGCPGLAIEQTLQGPKIVADRSSCVSDGACAKINACPSFEEVVVRRQAPPAQKRAWPVLKELPEPTRPLVDPVWYAFVAGVGGMGAGLVSEIFVKAAHQDGFRTLFLDKKGLAVRNGGVYAHLVLSRHGGTLSPVIPYGKADLLIGLDLLETARSIKGPQSQRVASPDRTRAVVNTAEHPTIRMLMGTDTMDRPAQEEGIREHVQAQAFDAVDASALAMTYLGSTLYANMVLLGIACQRGYLPLSLHSLEEAIAQSVSKDDRTVNLQAFVLGRGLAAFPECFSQTTLFPRYNALLEEKTQFLHQLYGRDVATGYRKLVEETIFELDDEDHTHLQLALRVYELVCYQDLTYARRYVDLVLMTARKDRRAWGRKVTQAVLEQAHRVMAIKDEVYVAHLLTSPEKQKRDRDWFQIDPSNGDRLVYRHFNSPEFTVFGKSIRWTMVTRDWQLRLVRRLKFLRHFLPGWHQREKDFRDWYLSLASSFEAHDETSYNLWVDLLRLPETVLGYREIRWPKMDEARQKAILLMKKLNPSRSPSSRIPQGRRVE